MSIVETTLSKKNICREMSVELGNESVSIVILDLADFFFASDKKASVRNPILRV